MVRSNKLGTKKRKRTKENELRRKMMWYIDIAFVNTVTFLKDM